MYHPPALSCSTRNLLCVALVDKKALSVEELQWKVANLEKMLHAEKNELSSYRSFITLLSFLLSLLPPSSLLPLPPPSSPSSPLTWLPVAPPLFPLLDPALAAQPDLQIPFHPASIFAPTLFHILFLRCAPPNVQGTRECLAIAVRRLQVMDMEQGGMGGGGKGGKDLGLKGNVSEGGRVGTPTRAQGVLARADGGGAALRLSTIAIDLTPLILEEAILQLEGYNEQVKKSKHQRDVSRQHTHKSSSILVEDHVAIKEATAVLDGIILESMFRDILNENHLNLTFVDIRAGRSDRLESLVPEDVKTILNEINSSWAFVSLLGLPTDISNQIVYIHFVLYSGSHYGARLRHRVAIEVSLTPEYAWMEELAGRSFVE
eukprot:753952-Hanusia_phi.AAC.3